MEFSLFRGSESYLIVLIVRGGKTQLSIENKKRSPYLFLQR
jgi:hypothetical protein